MPQEIRSESVYRIWLSKFLEAANKPVPVEWFLTAVIFAVAVFIYLRVADADKAAELGEYISGFSAALAFLWLIVGLRYQSADLRMQREELSLQRSAIEKQAKELKNTSKFTSLSQIETILERAVLKIKESGTGANEPKDITTVWMNGMKGWKGILESTDSSFIEKEYLRWLPIENLARSYLARVALALKLYMEHHLDREFDAHMPNEKFVYIYSSWGNQAPYLSEHIGNAYIIANWVFISEPGLKALRVAGLFAMRNIGGAEMFHNDALEQMKQELIDVNAAVPAIAMP